MLVACRLAGLSALEAQYAGINVCTQSGVLLCMVRDGESLQRSSSPTWSASVGARCGRRSRFGTNRGAAWRSDLPTIPCIGDNGRHG